MDSKSLDSVGEAVTYKIREAITNKLVELNVPFEKELPDYIMVMVANKKSRAQMTEDLILFLGEGTDEFMNWFENIMKKFQSGSVKQVDDFSFSGTNESRISTLMTDFKVKSNSTSLVKPLTNWSNESDILTLEIPEQDADLLGEDLKDVSKSAVVCHDDYKNVGNKVSDTRCVKIVQASYEDNLKGLTSPLKKHSISVPENFPLQQKGKLVPCSAVVPVKRSKTAAEINSESEEPFGSVASIIRVTERKSSVPLAMQANKLLLLKAVDAANKSVMALQKPLRSTKSADVENSGMHLDMPLEKDVRIAVLEEGQHSSRIMGVQRKLAVAKNSYLLPESQEESIDPIYPSMMPNIGVQYNASSLSFEKGSVMNKESSNSDNCEKIDKACATEEESSKCRASVSTRFVVTLDGIDPTTLKRKRKMCETPMEVDSDETCYPRVCLNTSTRDFVPLDNDAVSPVEKKLKINEKCRYWPACKNGDLCNYHHPTTTCKAFPNCTYGDKCLFIHPNCKFDALCTRKDCPYTHASKRKIPSADTVPPKKSNFTTVIPCKYFPNCASESCPYFHPRACWYGSACKISSCLYGHSLPVRGQLKWCAP